MVENITAGISLNDNKSSNSYKSIGKKYNERNKPPFLCKASLSY
jgi:hypothetical protein